MEQWRSSRRGRRPGRPVSEMVSSGLSVIGGNTKGGGGQSSSPSGRDLAQRGQRSRSSPRWAPLQLQLRMKRPRNNIVKYIPQTTCGFYVILFYSKLMSPEITLIYFEGHIMGSNERDPRWLFSSRLQVIKGLGLDV